MLLFKCVWSFSSHPHICRKCDVKQHISYWFPAILHPNILHPYPYSKFRFFLCFQRKYRIEFWTWFSLCQTFCLLLFKYKVCSVTWYTHPHMGVGCFSAFLLFYFSAFLLFSHLKGKTFTCCWKISCDKYHLFNSVLQGWESNNHF